MALTDFNIDTSGSPQDVQRKQALADALMKQGQDSTPAAGGPGGGWITALNRGLAGALGGYQQGQARQEEQQGRSDYQQQLASALGAGGQVTPSAMIGLAGNPWANPAQTQAITHVADMQAQQARQGVEDKHWAASYGLQQQAAARAAQAADRANMSESEKVDERIAALKAHNIDPNSPQGQAFAYNGKMPDMGAASRPMTPEERKAYGLPAEGGAAMTRDGPKTLGAPTTNFTANIDNKGPDEYDKTVAGAIAKSHGALMSGVEDAQQRARDLAAQQGAVDAIQKGGGSTGGLGQPQLLDAAKTLNSAATSVGLNPVFNEKNISDKELLAKFNRDMAGAQAKGAVGSRVTNFEMSNYLKANPGLETSITGNQRLIGIKSQIEQRNVAVGQAMRAAAANAIGSGTKVDPAKMEQIIKDYDLQHHVKDPITGQDLTQSYALPEFQNVPGSSNPALSADHSANVKKIGGYTVKQVSP